MIDQGRGSNLCDQFLLTISLTAEEGRTSEAIQSGSMSSAVGQFVKNCAVIFGGADELLADREDNFIGTLCVFDILMALFSQIWQTHD